jgi:hypothetical protein
VSRDPAATVDAIDRALAKTRGMGLTDIEICLDWLRYSDLLALKGIDWQPTERGLDARHEDRPLKVYRGHVLRLTSNSAPQVLGRRPDRSLTGWAV